MDNIEEVFEGAIDEKIGKYDFAEDAVQYGIDVVVENAAKAENTPLCTGFMRILSTLLECSIFSDKLKLKFKM